jgi:hypothetical protein
MSAHLEQTARDLKAALVLTDLPPDEDTIPAETTTGQATGTT